MAFSVKKLSLRKPYGIRSTFLCDNNHGFVNIRLSFINGFWNERRNATQENDHRHCTYTRPVVYNHLGRCVSTLIHGICTLRPIIGISFCYRVVSRASIIPVQIRCWFYRILFPRHDCVYRTLSVAIFISHHTIIAVVTFDL